MTKEKIEWIIKRYKYIDKAIQNNLSSWTVYIGNRKHSIFITDEIKKAYRIIEDIREAVSDGWVKKMIEGLLRGKSDVALIMTLPCERSMFYDRKRKFIEMVYRCCIARQMVRYEQLLREGIA